MNNQQFPNQCNNKQFSLNNLPTFNLSQLPQIPVVLPTNNIHSPSPYQHHQPPNLNAFNSHNNNNHNNTNNNMNNSDYASSSNSTNTIQSNPSFAPPPTFNINTSTQPTQPAKPPTPTQVSRLKSPSKSSSTSNTNNSITRRSRKRSISEMKVCYH